MQNGSVVLEKTKKNSHSYLHLLCTNYAPNHLWNGRGEQKVTEKTKIEPKSYDLARFFVHFVKNAGLSDKT